MSKDSSARYLEKQRKIKKKACKRYQDLFEEKKIQKVRIRSQTI